MPLVAIPVDVQNFKLVDYLDPTLFFNQLQLRLLNQPTIQSIPKKGRVPFVEEYNKLLLRILENNQDLVHTWGPCMHVFKPSPNMFSVLPLKFQEPHDIKNTFLAEMLNLSTPLIVFAPGRQVISV